MRSPASRVIVVMLRDHSLTGVMTKRSCRADSVHVAYTDGFVLNGPGAGGPGKHLVVAASGQRAKHLLSGLPPARTAVRRTTAVASRTVLVPALFVDTLHIDRLGIAPDGRLLRSEAGGHVDTAGHGRTWARAREGAFDVGEHAVRPERP